METLGELIAIRNMIDRVLSKNPALEVQSELYSSRIFVVRAIKEQTAEPEVRAYTPLTLSVQKVVEA